MPILVYVCSGLQYYSSMIYRVMHSQFLFVKIKPQLLCTNHKNTAKMARSPWETVISDAPIFI